MSVTFNEALRNFLKTLNVSIFGVADLSLYNLEENPPILRSCFEQYKYAISIAIRLDDNIIDKIDSKPTPAYADHYREINRKLDFLSEKIKKWVEEKGFIAYAILASKIFDEENLKGELSHKTIARLAGIGWQGKSLLIINPYYGPRFRLATILTDMPLVPNKPLKNRCGNCDRCKNACPAQAIKGLKVEEYYKSREEAVFLERCCQKLLAFKELDGINATVCGICIKVCPWGKLI